MNKLRFMPVLLFYTILSLLLFPFYRYNILQDQISYITIAEKYTHGLFYDAVNGVWSPMISWLLVPFIEIGIDPAPAFRILQLLIGFFVLCTLLFYVHKENKIVFALSGYISAVVLVTAAYFTGTPDLLMTGFLLIYISLMKLAVSEKKRKYFLAAGIIGALAFFAKAYAFPFFIAHLTLTAAWLFFTNRKSGIIILKNYGLSLFLFLVITAPWIYLLSVKYDHLTYSTAGEYNFAVVGPEYQNTHKFRMTGLIPPVNETALSYWEDPSFLSYTTWSPFENIENFTYTLRMLSKNFLLLLTFYLSYSPLILLIFFRRFRKGLKQDFYSAGVILLYSSGLLMLFIEQRFLILPQLLLILLTFKLVSEYNHNTTGAVTKFIWVAAYVTMLFRPVYTLLNNFNPGKDLHYISRYLDGRINGNLASYTDIMLHKDFASSMIISFLTENRYFGEIPTGNFEQLRYEIEKYNINYLLVWDTHTDFTPMGFRKVFSFSFSDRSSLLRASFLQSAVNPFYRLFNISTVSDLQRMLVVYKIDNQDK